MSDYKTITIPRKKLESCLTTMPPTTSVVIQKYHTPDRRAAVPEQFSCAYQREGLNRADLNGLEGSILAWHDEKERYSVALLRQSAGAAASAPTP